MDIFVLNKNFKKIGIVDDYTSLIWSNRYNDLGDCELYIKATTKNMELLKKGNYLFRDDDEMVCQIKKSELDTSTEDGDYLIVTGYDVKTFLDQRVIWGTASVDGNEEDFLRNIVNNNLGNPNLSSRQLRKENGERMLYLGNKANFKEVIQEQVSYKNVGEKIRETCVKNSWGYKVVLSEELLYFLLYKGTDRSDSVIFSNDFENLISTKYIEDDTNLGNVALVAGEGEGSERARNVSGYSESTDRYEIYVDAKDISRTITWGDLITMYPTTDQGGQGYIYKTTSDAATYKMNYIDIPIVDSNQLTELKNAYPDGTEIIKDGVKYYQVYNAIIADLSSFSPQTGDSVILRDLVYAVYLLNRGYEKLAEYGSTKSFEGSVEPDVTFKYKKDYFLGDLVTVSNEYGIEVQARIVEVVEVDDDNGYSVEPKFEYIYNPETTPTLVSGYILSEVGAKMLTENNEYLMREEAIIPTATDTDTTTYSLSSSENVKISELPEIEELADGCCMPIVSFGKTTKIFYSTLKEKLQNDIPQTKVSIGQTITGEAGTNASVTNSGTETEAVFDFVIPRGKDGETPQMMINSDGHLIAIYDN